MRDEKKECRRSVQGNKSRYRNQLKYGGEDFYEMRRK